MLYPKNRSKKLDDGLFKNPTSEYRGTPFWAWNCELDKEESSRQIDMFQKMGFGGFHMHVRTGLSTPYMSEEFLDQIEHCVDHAEKREMLAWLYDEDRWPSGAAGGIVTREEHFRARHLMFTPVSYEEASESEDKVGHSRAAAQRTGNGRLLACYDIELNDDGSLKSAHRIEKDASAAGTKWYAYLEVALPSGWFNNQTYVNTLDKNAIDRFIDVTYEPYHKRIGNRFGDRVPAIFTDEPQFTQKSPLRFAKELADVFLPWTDDLPETFKRAYGEDILEQLPELIWDLPNGEASVIRYHYHDHVCQRFTEAFADNCGSWCRDHGLMLTGHMMEEPTLKSQTAALGEAMRSYRGFDLPGIDMLCARFEYTTAKQTQSAVHQFGYEGMLSEIYGVTNWDFDFRGHKLHGDWQAAMGVTVRVPHLSWMSMAGEAKRDYPAPISDQSPWWSEYSAVENHFARLNTALTRGKPEVRVGVIHPIESYWLHWGPEDASSARRERMDALFQNLTEWLLFGMIDFDFISESLLPDQCACGGAPLEVGKMCYDAIIVPGCETLRSTTIERLEAFRTAGGRLIFLGEAPKLEDAKPSDRGAKLYAASEHAEAEKGSVLEALEPVRSIDARDESGRRCDYLIYQMREDTDGHWLFVSHAKEPYNKDVCRYHEVRLTLKGHYSAELYDTINGTHAPMQSRFVGENTELRVTMYDYDSLLVYLTDLDESVANKTDGKNIEWKPVPVDDMVPYALSEPNVLLLDRAQYALDDEAYRPAEELLRADNECRSRLGWPGRQESFAQPWVTPDEPIVHSVRLKFNIHSDIELENIALAVEDAACVGVRFNGATITTGPNGWYVDRAIGCIPLGCVREGENVLELTVPFGRRTNIEWAYLIGDFGVRVNGSRATITSKSRTIGFGDICMQGLPFYGGNITYRVRFESGGGKIRIQCPHYRGALIKASVDGGKAVRIIYPPYEADFGGLEKGEHVAEITLFGNRRNSFGPVHLADLCETWIGPNAWRSKEDYWSDSYQLCRVGILSEPRIFEEI